MGTTEVFKLLIKLYLQNWRFKKSAYRKISFKQKAIEDLNFLKKNNMIDLQNIKHLIYETNT